MHEPEGVSHMDRPVVVDGEWVGWVSHGYTVDYVACSPDSLLRICVESKYDAEAVDATALDKCRRLRDSQITRVLLVYGHGDELRWLDFGPVHSTEAPVPSRDFPVRLLPSTSAATPSDATRGAAA